MGEVVAAFCGASLALFLTREGAGEHALSVHLRARAHMLKGRSVGPGYLNVDVCIYVCVIHTLVKCMFTRVAPHFDRHTSQPQKMETPYKTVISRIKGVFLLLPLEV